MVSPGASHRCRPYLAPLSALHPQHVTGTLTASAWVAHGSSSRAQTVCRPPAGQTRGRPGGGHLAGASAANSNKLSPPHYQRTHSSTPCREMTRNLVAMQGRVCAVCVCILMQKRRGPPKFSQNPFRPCSLSRAAARAQRTLAEKWRTPVPSRIWRWSPVLTSIARRSVPRAARATPPP